jgi:hypothetical protein
VLEQLHGKTQVMKLLTHADPNVRYHALLAVQKLMVHNWEYLGKQLEVRACVSCTSSPVPSVQEPKDAKDTGRKDGAQAIKAK